MPKDKKEDKKESMFARLKSFIMPSPEVVIEGKVDDEDDEQKKRDRKELKELLGY